jgi:hypothetical protein
MLVKNSVLVLGRMVCPLWVHYPHLQRLRLGPEDFDSALLRGSPGLSVPRAGVCIRWFFPECLSLNNLCGVCVPFQLFTKPHPARTTAGKPLPGKDASTPAILPSHPQSFLHSLQALKPSQVTVKGDYLALHCPIFLGVCVPSETGFFWRFRDRDLGIELRYGLEWLSLNIAGICRGLCSRGIQDH